MELTFFGQSGWGFEVDGSRVIVDPYPISDDSRAAIDSFADESLDYVLVTHAGFDHLGIALELVERSASARLVADVAVVRHAAKSGLPDERVMFTGWNLERAEGPWRFRGVEAKHASVIETVDGEFITGMPVGFVVWHESEPEVRVFHLGDTSIFSDLALFGQLYNPLLAIINVRGAMSAREAALSALWMGVDIALPVHFMHDRSAAEEFCAAVSYMPREIQTWVPETGSKVVIERVTRVSH
jgi:L-ascorbate metabolism protein UlaG (beta-lactamase superfamily)